MKTTRLLMLIVFVTQLSIVFADNHLSLTPPEVDTSKWKCRYCLVEEGWSGEVEGGFGYVSDSSWKFGEYTGLNEEGGFLIANANVHYRNADAGYTDLLLTNVGLDSSSLSIEGGVQGRYKLFLTYDEIAHYISNTGSSPYQGAGSDSLTLPTGWVTAGTTGGMTSLAADLKNVGLETHRKNLGVGVSLTPSSHWEYGVTFRHDTKEGTKRAAGSFFFDSAQLIEPVDYVTDEIGAFASYTANKWQANLAYIGSTFSNNNKSLTWDNAYTPIVANADEGQLALPPDNQFHQIILSAGYDISERSRLSGDIAIGHMEQDESLVAATQNTNFGPLAVPSSNSANAEADTVNAKIRYISAPTNKLRLTAAYHYNDRDNKTPQLTYDWVTTDAFLATPRTNLPYSFTQGLLKLKADYNLAKGTRLGVGYDLDKRERTFQEIEKTNEDTLWGDLRLRRIKNMFFKLKLVHSKRDGSTYEAVSAIDPPENVLIRKYNMADRVRNSLEFHANITPESPYTVGLEFDIAENDYDNSVLGLTDSRETSINIDVTTMVSEATSINAFIGYEVIESNQVGSQTFSTPDWWASNDDSFNNFGFGVAQVVIRDKLNIGADYTRSSSTGKITVTSGAPDPAFPDLSTDLDIFRLYADYHYGDNLYLRAAYWHERYDSDDWALDGVSADTIPKLLSLGELSPSYSVNVIKLSMGYKF